MIALIRLPGPGNLINLINESTNQQINHGYRLLPTANGLAASVTAPILEA